eukprot:Plantae.Rhodophyta-Hildenbrandia_rubra.ctg3062.p1 GENE.Plantae.Rhodophyta-Hildenbrandia_rubra.ctg3062~~Plantae.Rhodophyta-Hildenbrandia_rubra.ctg3062.p1  ORF type:complete len:456 (-),score=112.05 Plantae.Rhodophyta-Hildenbrandia_rubra.ctg3062:943-2310(-)
METCSQEYSQNLLEETSLQKYPKMLNLDNIEASEDAMSRTTSDGEEDHHHQTHTQNITDATKMKMLLPMPPLGKHDASLMMSMSPVTSSPVTSPFIVGNDAGNGDRGGKIEDLFLKGDMRRGVDFGEDGDNTSMVSGDTQVSEDVDMVARSGGGRRKVVVKGRSSMVTRRAAAEEAEKKKKDEQIMAAAAAKALMASKGRKGSRGNGGVVKKAYEKGNKKKHGGVAAKVLEPKVGQTRYWTQAEHEKFLVATAKYGEKRYVEISNFVGTRTPKQVRTHAQKFQMKMARMAKQRAEEEQVQNRGCTPTQEPRAVPQVQVPVVQVVEISNRVHDMTKVESEVDCDSSSPSVMTEDSTVLPDPYLSFIGSECKEDGLDQCFVARFAMNTMEIESKDDDESNSVADILASEDGSQADDFNDANLEGHGDFSYEPFSNPAESWLSPEDSDDFVDGSKSTL